MYRVKPFAETFDPVLVSGCVTISIMQTVEVKSETPKNELPICWQPGPQPTVNSRRSMVSLPASASEEMLTIQDVAKLLKICDTSVRKMSKRGELPRPKKIGSNVRWLAAEIREWQQRTAEGASESPGGG